MNISEKFSGKTIILLLGVSLASFIGNADYGIVNTAAPEIQTQLHLTFVQSQWIMNAFLLTIGILMILTGKLADVLGRRRVFYTGLIFFLFASGLAGYAVNISMLIIARVIQAIAAAILFTSSGSLVNNSVPAHSRTRAMGIFWSLAMLGVALGPILGGIITHFLSWRWIFFINFPLIAISLIMCIPTIPASANQRTKENIDWLGFLLFAIFVGSIVFAAINFTQVIINNILIISLLILAVLMAITLYFRETRCQYPLLSSRLFSQKRFFICALFSLTVGSFYGLAFFIMPFYLNNAQGLNDLKLGIFLLPATLILSLISTYIGLIIEKGASLKGLLCFGFFALMLSATLQLFFTATTSLWLVTVPLIILGIGWGFVTNPSTIVALECGDESMSGVILGTVFTMFNVGSSIAIATGTALFHGFAKASLLQELASHHISIHSYDWINNVISDPRHAIDILIQQTGLSSSVVHQLFTQYFMSGYHAAMGYLAILALLTFLIVWKFLPADNKKHIAVEAEQIIPID